LYLCIYKLLSVNFQYNQYLFSPKFSFFVKPKKYLSSWTYIFLTSCDQSMFTKIFSWSFTNLEFRSFKKILLLWLIFLPFLCYLLKYSHPKLFSFQAFLQAHWFSFQIDSWFFLRALPSTDFGSQFPSESLTFLHPYNLFCLLYVIFEILKCPCAAKSVTKMR